MIALYIFPTLVPQVSKNMGDSYIHTKNHKDFYYLHSYQVLPKNDDDIIAYYERGGSKINAAIANGNIWGVQFHPEKSGEVGLEFLKAFSNLNNNI